MDYVTHLIVGDAHVAPGQNLDRFKHLGKWAADHQPERIVFGGDHVTFDSCSYYKIPANKRTTARDDIDAGIEAFDLFFGEISKLQKRQRKNKHKVYQPYCIFTGGNHEDRLNRRMQDDEDVLGSLVNLFDLLGIPERFDDYCGYREYIELDGILYTHCPVNGRLQPITGINRTRTIALQSALPVVFFHTHKFEYRTVPLLGNLNSFKWALNCPMFADQNHVEEYALDGTTGWAYGVIELRIYEDDTAVFRWISMEELKENYTK